MGSIVEKWREFCEWQQRPYQVAPMSEEHHCCHTCGQEFQGNYCPRCGQSAKIGRYSFRKALLLFLDVWGLGNRGMFRTLRDLILRPGYMIRDYLSGMQMAYFPPFKLFFLLTTLSLVVESGFNLKGQNYFETTVEQFREGFGFSFEEQAGEELTEEQKKYNKQTEAFGFKVMDYAQKFPNVMTLAMLLVMSGYLYIFFRKSPNIPDLRFSELLVALVYTSDMFSVYNIVMEFLCLPLELIFVSMLLPLLPLKQMSGFKWWKIIFIIICVFVMMMISLFVLGGVAMFLGMMMESIGRA